MFRRYEQRCFIKIQFARGKNASQCFRALQEACRREVLPDRTIVRWVEAFCQGREECQHRARAYRPVGATDDLHVQAVRVVLEEDRRWTCLEISRELGIAASTVYTILIKKLNIQKVCAHWVPHTLTEIGKWQQMETARMHLERYEHEGKGFLRRIITMDETWIRLCTPELHGRLAR